ncbi:MAG: diacylglycerol kinase family lipid kinase [Cytophagales bacterium]|nr:MAG: diacylglycerol kinase family lipid kinase [Cytophagales bacterium]
MRKILFIINPISGGVNKEYIPKLIDRYLDKNIFQSEVQYTAYPLHAKEIAKNAVNYNYDIVAAVGGDGTINEIASELVNTEVKLAIIPLGSGNGLARHLNIPLDTKKAIIYLNSADILKIDVGRINNKYFFCTSGIGFDAIVANEFASLTKRGLLGYLKTSIMSYLRYHHQFYKLSIDGKKIEEKALLITFANASQFGNNAHIAPIADISDGLIDVSILRPFHWWESMSLAFHLFTKKLHQTNFIKIYKAKTISLEINKKQFIHIDGEPFEINKELNVHLLPQSLNVMAKDKKTT